MIIEAKPRELGVTGQGWRVLSDGTQSMDANLWLQLKTAQLHDDLPGYRQLLKKAGVSIPDETVFKPVRSEYVPRPALRIPVLMESITPTLQGETQHPQISKFYARYNRVLDRQPLKESPDRQPEPVDKNQTSQPTLEELRLKLMAKEEAVLCRMAAAKARSRDCAKGKIFFMGQYVEALS